jgi:iron-sulfur cluster repair protein YtfE (RIC family)
VITSHLASHLPLHEPIERFCGSHSGIVDGLNELLRLPALAEQLKQARATAEATLALFERQVVPHHVDEEEDLFVAVLRSARAGAEKAGVEDMVVQLVAEHRRIERMWTALRPVVCAVAAGKKAVTAGFGEAVAELVETYFEHVRREEQVFLPLADQILARDPNHMAALAMSVHLRHAPMLRMAYI